MRLLYPDLSSVSERLIREAAEKQINVKTQAKNIFNNNINIIKDIKNYYETKTNNYNKKSSRYKNYITVAVITEIVLSSIATTATSTSVALTGIGLPYSIPTAFCTHILYTFTLTELPGYLINIIPTNISYQNVTKDRIEYIEFHIKDEHGRPIDFNGNALSFTLHLI